MLFEILGSNFFVVVQRDLVLGMLRLLCCSSLDTFDMVLKHWSEISLQPKVLVKLQNCVQNFDNKMNIYVANLQY